MKYNIRYYDFRHTCTNRKYPSTNKCVRFSSVYFNPENMYFGFYGDIFTSLDKVSDLIFGIEEVLNTGISKQLSGEEESFFEVNPKEIALVITLPGYEEPLYLDTVAFLKVLVEYREWLLLVESCQVPGLIPQSKLNTWSCVPNEYVKPEYWELLKQQNNS